MKEKPIPTPFQDKAEDVFAPHIKKIAEQFERIRYGHKGRIYLTIGSSEEKFNPSNLSSDPLRSAVAVSLSDAYAQAAVITVNYHVKNAEGNLELLGSYTMGEKEKSMRIAPDHYGQKSKNTNTASDTSYKYWLYQQAQRQIRQDQSMPRWNEVDPDLSPR